MPDPDQAASPTVPSVHSLKGPQFIVAMYAMTIVLLVMVLIFLKGSEQLFNSASMLLLGSVVGGVVGFYFQSSVGSQAKDAAAAPPSFPPVQ